MTELPKYQNIQGWLMRELSCGKYQVGDKFYSENELSKQFGVTPVTARQAMTYLESHGYVVRKQGSGTFVKKIPSQPVRIKLMNRCMIGLVTAGVELTNNMTIGQTIVNLYKEANERGYLVLLTHDDISLFLEAEVEGIIILDNPSENVIHKIQESGLPYVGYSHLSEEHVSVKLNYRQAAKDIIDKFAETGHKHIAVVGEGQDSLIVYNRFKDYLLEAKAHYENLTLSFCVTKEKKMQEHLNMLFQERNHPDALFITNSWCILKAMEVLEANNLKVPDNVSILVHGSNALTIPTKPPLSVITTDISARSRMAMNLLQSLIRKAHNNIEANMLEYKIIDRGSIKTSTAMIPNYINCDTL